MFLFNSNLAKKCHELFNYSCAFFILSDVIMDKKISLQEELGRRLTKCGEWGGTLHVFKKNENKISCNRSLFGYMGGLWCAWLFFW